MCRSIVFYWTTISPGFCILQLNPRGIIILCYHILSWSSFPLGGDLQILDTSTNIILVNKARLFPPSVILSLKYHIMVLLRRWFEEIDQFCWFFLFLKELALLCATRNGQFLCVHRQLGQFHATV